MKTINNPFKGLRLFLMSAILLCAGFESMATVTVTASPATISQFDGEGSPGDSEVSTLTCSITMFDDHIYWVDVDWNVGDGIIISSDPSPIDPFDRFATHSISFSSTYTGDHTVTCTVSYNSSSDQESGTVTVNVQAPNELPPLDPPVIYGWTESALSQGRKISLTGMPMPDVAQHQEGESDYSPENTHVDALSLDLIHDTTDIHVPVGTGQFALEVRRSLTQENWESVESLPLEEHAGKPFGPCWKSTISPAIHIIKTYSDDYGDQIKYGITDHMGRSYSFTEYATGWDTNQNPTAFEKYKDISTTQSALSMQGVRFEYDDESAPEKGTLTLPNGTALEYANLGSWESGGSYSYYDENDVYYFPGGDVYDPLRTNQVLATHGFCRLEKVTDRYGHTLTYSYADTDDAIPTNIVSSAGQALSITVTNLGTFSDPTNRVAKIQDPVGNEINYAYNSSNQLYQVIRPNGSTTTYAYEETQEPDTDYCDDGDLYYNLGVTLEYPDFVVTKDYRHLTIKSITDANDNTYAFSFTDPERYYAWTKEYYYGGTVQIYSEPYRPKLQNPRILTEILLPDEISRVHFAEFKDPGLDINGIYDGSGGLSGRRENFITNVNGKVWSYYFSDPKGCDPAPGDGLREVWTYEYSQLAITAPDNAGTEEYWFERLPGMVGADGLKLMSAVSNVSWSGSATEYEYDYFDINNVWESCSKPSSKIDTFDEVRLYNYTTNYNFQVETVDDEMGRKTEYQIDTIGNRTKETRYAADATTVLAITEMEYGNTNFPNFMTKQTVKTLAGAGDPAWVGDLVTEFVPHQYGKVRKSIVDPDGLALTTTYDYDLNNNLLSTINPNGNMVTNGYDNLNRLVGIAFFEGTSTLKSTKRFWYDLRGNKTWEKDENNHYTYFEFDEFNNATNTVRIMAERSDPSDGLESYTPTAADIVTSSEFNADGTLFATVDPRGLRTEFSYDELRRLTNSVVDPGGLAYETSYEYTGNCGSLTLPPYKFMPTKTIDPRGYTTETTYDALNRPVEIKAEVSNGVYAITWNQYDAAGNLVAVSNLMEGSTWQVTRTEFDDLNRPVVVTNADWTLTQARYTSTGLQWKSIDELERETVVVYDLAGRSVKTISPEIDGVHAETETGYDASGNMVWIEDAEDNISSNVFDYANRLVKTIAPEVWDEESQQNKRPVVITYYDSVGNVTGILDVRQNFTTNFFDAANRLTNSILPEVVVYGGLALRANTTTTYDKNGNPRFVTDANEVTVEMQYDLLNRLTNTIDGELNSIGYRYDESGNRTKIIDQNLNETQFVFDGLSRNTKIVYPDLSEENFGFDLVGNRISRADAKAQRTDYEFDLRNRLDFVSYMDGATTNRTRDYVYSDVGNLLDVVEIGNQQSSIGNVHYTYDALNRVMTETSAGVTHQYRYDLNSNRTNAVYGVTGRSVDWFFDGMNRIDRIEDTQGYTATVNVSGGGTNLQAAIDGAATGSLILVADGVYGPVTIDKPVTVKSQNGPSTTIIQATNNRVALLGSNANLIGFTLTGGAITGTNQCGAGALIGKGCLIADCIVSNNVADGINAFGGGLFLKTGATAQNCEIKDNSALDGGGVFCEKGGIVRNCTIQNNVATSIGGGGIFMEEGGWMADSIVQGNIATNTYARGGGGLFFYNPGGKVNSSTITSNLCSVASGDIGTRRSEFKDRRPIGELNHSILWNNTPVSTSEEWTGTGNVYVNPATVTSASGADISVCSYTSAGTRTTSFKYDLNSNLRLRSLPNGTTESRTFDALNRLESLDIFDPSVSSVYSVAYQHDPVGNLRQMDDLVDGLHTIPQSTTYAWAYDAAYRLESESVSASSAPLRETQFDWDDAGNRTVMRKYSGGSLASTTVYNPASDLNQMMGWTCGNTNAVYLYDANGARTNKTVTTTEYTDHTETTAYSYDEDNRLIGVDVVNNAGETNSWAFGYDYRTRRISRETPTEKTLHVFDGGLSVQEYDTSTSTTPSASNLSTESIRGEGMGGGVGGMVYSIKNGQLKASHSNHRGDVVAKTDASGNLSWFARYNAYGTRFHEVGVTHDRQRGNTKDEEEPLGLSNQHNRWLDIEHGVWLTRDPMGFIDTPNLYLYVRNNPVNKFDPLGLKSTATRHNAGSHWYSSAYVDYLDPGDKGYVAHFVQDGVPMVQARNYERFTPFGSIAIGKPFNDSGMIPRPAEGAAEMSYFKTDESGKTVAQSLGSGAMDSFVLSGKENQIGPYSDKVEQLGKLSTSLSPMPSPTAATTLGKVALEGVKGLTESAMQQMVDNGKITAKETVSGTLQNWVGSAAGTVANLGWNFDQTSSTLEGVGTWVVNSGLQEGCEYLTKGVATELTTVEEAPVVEEEETTE